MQIVCREDPIRRTPVVVDFRPEERLTIAQIAARVPLRDARLRPHLRARIGRDVVPRHLWGSVRPLPDAPGGQPAMLVLEVPLAGGGKGGGGGKKIFSAIAAIALIGLSVFTAGGSLAPLLGGAFAKGALGAQLLGAALSIGGAFLLQGLAPEPEKPKREQQIGFAGASNNFQPAAPLPRVLGTHRIPPPYVVPPYTTINEDDQYVTAVYGLAGWHRVENLMNGEVPLSEGSDVEIEVIDGDPVGSNGPISFLDDTVSETSVNLRLSEHQFAIKDTDVEEGILRDQDNPENSIPRWHGVRTRKNPHRFVVNFLFDQGMIRNSPSSGPRAIGVFFRGRFRRVGDVAWTYLPQMYVMGKASSKAVRVQTEFKWMASPPATEGLGDEWKVSVGGSPEFDGDGWSGLGDLPGETVPNQWKDRLSGSAGTYYTGASLHNGRRTIRFYLDTDVYPKGTYDFEFMKSFAIADPESISIDSDDPNWFEYTISGGGNAQINRNPTRYSHSAAITSVQSIWPEHPIRYDVGNRACLIAVRVRNMQLDRVSCVASGRSHRGAGPTLENPADALRHVLTELFNARPVPGARLDVANLDEWRAICATQGFEVNAVVEGENLLDVIKMICRAGHASPRFGPSIGVAIDRPRPGPVGLITQANASAFATQKVLFDRPHAILATFNDETDEWRTREVAVYDDGYSATGSGGTSTATKFERVVYRGITSEDRVVERAGVDLLWMRHRSGLVTCTQDIEYLEHMRGDRVWVETDILGQQGGRARVVEVVGSADVGGVEELADVVDDPDVLSVPGGASLVSTIVLDERPDFGPADVDVLSSEDLLDEVDVMSLGGARAVAIRLSTGEVVVAEVESVDGRTVTLADPLDEEVYVGDLVSTGALARVARDMLVWDIMPTQDGTAELTLIDYAGDEMY